ncbi:MAG: hypothetical protein HPY76_11495 [Anaerolineae bacterium]|nr:hypothetical protein [Anaerolineae bacterium]
MNKLRTLLSAISRHTWFYPLALLTVMLLTYQLFIAQLGFYWDDWQVVFLAGQDGMQPFWRYFAYDRPFSIWTYAVTLPLFGLRPALWQLFTLLTRWLSVLGFVWTLNGIWSTRRREVRWMGVLLAVYPGFSQQWVSVAYSQHFITYALFTLSLALMVWAVRQPRRAAVYLPVAVLFSTLQLLTMEYFVGLELLRPLLLWLLLRREQEAPGKTLLRVLRWWSPFLLPLLIFFLYRFVLTDRLFPLIEVNDPVLLQRIANSPKSGTLDLLELALRDSLNVSVFGWLQTVLPETIDLSAATTVVSWCLGGLVALLALWAASAPQTGEDPSPPNTGDRFTRQALLLGSAALLLGGLPVWSTDRAVVFNNWADRFSLALMFGAVILLVGMVEWFSQKERAKAALYGILITFAVASHIRTADQYRRHWEIATSYYQQLVWRVPGLRQGAFILAPELSFSYASDYAIGFAINHIYSENYQTERTPVWWISGGRYAGSTVLPDYREGLPVKYTLRNLDFESSTSQALPVTFNHARGCLRVMDPIYQLVPRLSDFDDDLWGLTGANHMDQILPPGEQDAVLPREIYGKQPIDWCYYFEKADLARQFGQWEEVAALGSEAAENGYAPANGAEWLPFIIADAHLGSWDSAVTRSHAADQLTKGMRPALCALWNDFSDDGEIARSGEPFIRQALDEFSCFTVDETNP